MNEYRFNEIYEDMTHEFHVTITEEKQNLFRMVSGDTNPLHGDAIFASTRGYDGVVVFGMLTASFYSQLVGVFLPGKYCLFHSIDTKFIKPVFIGDELLVSGTVKEKREKFRQLVIQAIIKNQHNEKVSKAIITVGVLDDE